MKKSKILKVDQIKCDPKFYPREQTSWMVIYKYSEAMKSGSKFPPIIVAKMGTRYILVDGWHRLEAMKRLKKTHIQTEVLTGLTSKQLYIEALKRNTEHGYALTASEVARAILKLRSMKISKKDISNIMHITMDKIEPFVAKRATYGPNGEPVILKAPIQHLSRGTQDITVNYKQGGLGGQTQLSLLSELRTILKNDWLDIENPKVRKLAEEVKVLLGQAITSKRGIVARILNRGRK